MTLSWGEFWWELQPAFERSAPGMLKLNWCVHAGYVLPRTIEGRRVPDVLTSTLAQVWDTQVCFAKLGSLWVFWTNQGGELETNEDLDALVRYGAQYVASCLRHTASEMLDMAQRLDLKTGVVT